MERLGGLIILIGLYALGRGGYEFYRGIEGALSTSVVGIAFVGFGYVLVNLLPSRRGAAPGPAGEAAPEKEGQDGRGGTAGTETGAEAEAEVAPAQAVFSVVQTGDDDVLVRVERLLKEDPRITDIVSESGQWHQTPDRDDLPEWHALRAYCARSKVETVIEESGARVREALGEEAAQKLSFSRFS